VKAGATEPAVLRSFEVLYEDLAPLRVAGRMIFRNLRDVMKKHVEQREQQDETIIQATGMSLDQIDGGRKTFMKILKTATPSSIISKQTNMGELTLKQMVDSGVVETIVELLGYKDFDELMQVLDQDQNGKVEFEEFMIALDQNCFLGASGEDGDGVSANHPECGIDGVLTELSTRMENFESQQQITISNKEERKKKASARYDQMVATFGEWEQHAPSREDGTGGGGGRMMDVLDGCFAGARNKGVVEALKIVYTDYSALKMAGDLIYSLMEKLMKRKKARKASTKA
jgi:hypothetical protein